MSDKEFRLRKIYRVCVFCPVDFLDPVIDAIKKTDELRNGDYSGVNWRSATGVEEFTPESGATPTRGESGKLHNVDSVRIEFSLPRADDILRRVLTSISEAHPWERPVVTVTKCKEWDITTPKSNPPE